MMKCNECGRECHYDICDNCKTLKALRNLQQQQRKTSEDVVNAVANVVEAVTEVKDVIKVAQEDLFNMMNGISERLDFMINQTIAPLSLPPPDFYDSLRDWIIANKETRYLAFIINSPAVYKIYEDIQNCFKDTIIIKIVKLKFRITEGVFVGLLTQLNDGNFVMINPEMCPQKALIDACANNVIDIKCDSDEDDGVRIIRVSVPKVRFIFITNNKDYLPPNTVVVWPQDDEKFIINQ